MSRLLPLAAALFALALRAGSPATSPEASLEGLEHRLHGRIGVAAVDTGTGHRLEYRAQTRFAMCSTFKVLLVGKVLARVDQGECRLDQPLAFGPGDLLAWAPVTRRRVGEGSMPVADLCAAALETSDNTAANLLIRASGGPPAVTAFARTLGDPTTRLDRLEPALNEALPGDPRDTTTPEAMLGTLRALLLGPALQPASRARLEAWMRACTTGRDALRVALPADWVAGDKTGSGGRGTTNDLAILRPPGRAPILVAAYLTGTEAPPEARTAALAEVGRIVLRALGFRNGASR